MFDSIFSAQPENAGFEISALRNYSADPDSVAGVGFWPRAAARIIDMIIQGFVGFVSGIIFTFILVVAGGGHLDRAVLARLQHTSFSGFLLGIVGAMAYHTICEGLHGSTPGKLMLSMVVIREDGSPCKIWPAFIRSAGYFVDALFFGLVGYFAMQKTPKEQRHGDEWAHTIVAKRDSIAPGSLRSRGNFVMALFLAAIVESMITMASLLLKVI
jgi:uncharacterized RDD family membrane protein YckC